MLPCLRRRGAKTRSDDFADTAMFLDCHAVVAKLKFYSSRIVVCAGFEIVEAALWLHFLVISGYHPPLNPPSTHAHVSQKVKYVTMCRVDSMTCAMVV